MRKFKNIVRKSMYQRIMDEVYSPLYKYDWVDVPDMENVSVSRCDKKWVSEIVSERLVQRMRGKRNGFPHLTVHSLRHMYASILLEQGVPLVKISALLGHSSIHTTFEFYCETMNDEDSIRDFMNMKFVPGGEA